MMTKQSNLKKWLWSVAGAVTIAFLSVFGMVLFGADKITIISTSFITSFMMYVYMMLNFAIDEKHEAKQ